MSEEAPSESVPAAGPGESGPLVQAPGDLSAQIQEALENPPAEPHPIALHQEVTKGAGLGNVETAVTVSKGNIRQDQPPEPTPED